MMEVVPFVIVIGIFAIFWSANEADNRIQEWLFQRSMKKYQKDHLPSS